MIRYLDYYKSTAKFNYFTALCTNEDWVYLETPNDKSLCALTSIIQMLYLLEPRYTACQHFISVLVFADI